MEMDIFHNNLRILLNIEFQELVQFKVFNEEDIDVNSKWTAFQRNPFKFFIRADTESANKIWGLIQARQPKNRE
jgi:hypothetical protein